MRRFFGLPVDGERAARGTVPDRSYVIAPLQAGLSEPAADLPQESWVVPAHLFAHRTQAAPEQIRIFTVQDNAMAPEFAAGETVLVDLSDGRPSPPGLFVISDGLGPIVRHCAVVPQSKPVQVRVTARNAMVEPCILLLDKVEIIGRVIARLQWL